MVCSHTVRFTDFRVFPGTGARSGVWHNAAYSTFVGSGSAGRTAASSPLVSLF